MSDTTLYACGVVIGLGMLSAFALFAGVLAWVIREEVRDHRAKKAAQDPARACVQRGLCETNRRRVIVGGRTCR